MAVATREQRELDGRGRLARTLEAGEHDHRRGPGRITKAFGIAAQELDQLVVHRLDHRLRGGEPGRDLDAGETRPHPLSELLDDFEVDVGLEQGNPDLAQTCVDVLRAEHTAAGDLLQGGGEPLAKYVEQLDGSFEPGYPPLESVQLPLHRGQGAAPPRRLREQAQPRLIVLHRARRAADDVVHRGERCALVRSDLRERPVAAKVEIRDLTLVVGEKGSVPLVEGERAATSLQGVKWHALTV